MALYKYKEYLEYADQPEFDTLHNPGEICPHSGIYRCEACGDEIASNKDNPFPPQNHHQHAENLGPIQWKLIIISQQR